MNVEKNCLPRWIKTTPIDMKIVLLCYLYLQHPYKCRYADIIVRYLERTNVMLKIFIGNPIPFASNGGMVSVRQLSLRTGVESEVDPLKLCRYFRAASQEGYLLKSGINIYDRRLHIDRVTRDGNVLVDFSETRKQTIAESVRLIDAAKAVLDKNPDKAIAILNRSVGIWSKNARAYRHLGQAYAKDGNHLYAKASFERSIKRNPSDAEAYAGLGKAGYSLGDNELSVTAFREAAVRYLSSRQYSKAKKACKKALQIQENHSFILFKLGTIHVELGEYEDARVVWKRAVEIEPSLLKKIVDRGGACIKSGEFDKAKEILECAVEIEPHNAVALARLGYAHLSLGEYQEGKLAFKKALSVDPQNLPCLANLAFIQIELNEYKAAKDVCKIALSIDPSNTFVLLHSANAHFHLGEYAQAKKRSQRLLRLEPDNYRALTTLGSAHLRLDECEAARDACQKAIDIQPDYVPALAYLADAYSALGDYAAAKSMYRRALDIEPNNMHALTNLGGFYIGYAEFRKAKDVLLRAVEIEPNYFYAWNTLGVVHSGLGELKEAKGAFKRALAIKPDDFSVWTNLAEVHILLGELREAVDVLGWTIEHDPHSVTAHLKLGRVYQLLGGVENHEKALDVYETLVEFWPNATAYYNLGEAYLRLEEYRKARDAYRAAVEKEPPDEYNFLRVGVLSLAINDLDAARNYLKNASSMFSEWDEIETCLAFMHWVEAKGHWDNKNWKAAKDSFQAASTLFAKLPDAGFVAAVGAYELSLSVERDLDRAVREKSIEGIYKRVEKAARNARKAVVKIERRNIPLLEAQAYCLEATYEMLAQARRIFRGKRINLERIDKMIADAEVVFETKRYEPGLEAVAQLKNIRHSMLDLNTGTQLQFNMAVKVLLKVAFTFVGLSATAAGYPKVGVGLSGVDLWKFFRRWHKRREDEVIRIVEGLDEKAALKELSYPRYASALRRIADPNSNDVRSQVLRLKAKAYLDELQQRKKG